MTEYAIQPERADNPGAHVDEAEADRWTVYDMSNMGAGPGAVLACYSKAEAEAFVDVTGRLEPLGFAPEIGGGGMVFMSRYFGAYGKPQWRIWLTGAEDGQGMPGGDDDYLLGVYAPSEDGMGSTLDIDSASGFTLDQAAALAIAFAAGPPDYRQRILAAEYAGWLAAQGETIPPGEDRSADVLVGYPGLSAEQVNYLGHFCRRWDEAEEENEA